MRCVRLQTSLILAAALLLIIAPRLAAQTVTGTILGTVKDATGASIPGVQISVNNLETGVVRTAITDDSGTYNVPSVPAGSYSITASIAGFKTEERRGIAVTVGASIAVNFMLTVGELEEKIEVIGGAPRVDAITSTMGGLVNEAIIRELPLNGRDWLQLATLEAGTVFAAGQTQSDSARTQRGSGLAISISGGRPTENAFRIDGLVVNDYANAGPGSTLRVNLGVDAIREFSVLTNTYSAEYGRSSGGVINAITKSGTNTIHGTAFYFHRNSALDARNFFDVEKPPFRRNQFGASVGGPIRENRTFFFANYEGLREFLSLSFVSDTLSPNARNGILTGRTVNVDPRVKPYLELYPLPNGPIAGNTGKLIFGGGRSGTEDFVLAKIDHMLSENSLLNVTYSFDRAEVATPDAFNQLLEGSPSRRQNFLLSFQHTFNPRVLNIVRLGISRTRAANEFDLETSNPRLEDPSLGFLPGRNIGCISVVGLSTLCGLGASDSNVFGYTAPQISDDLTWVRGRHSLRFGFTVERILSNLDAKDGPLGEWEFGSIEDLLLVRPRRFVAQFPGTDTTRGMRSSVVGAYIQDDIRLRPNVTLNLGLRYEVSTVIKEHHDRTSNLRNLTDAEPTLGDPYYENPSLRNFAPRIGFAWDPFGDGKTAIRSGFGIFDIVPLPYLFTNRMPRSTPFFKQGIIVSPPGESFPNGAFRLLGPRALRVAHVQFDPDRAYKMQWNLNIQREVIKDLTFMVGYVGSSGVHIPQSIEDIDQVPATLVTRTPDGRLLFPTTGPIQRINPNFGRIAATLWRGKSSYHALQLNLTKHMSRGLYLQGAYTWSKSIDNGSNTFSDAEYVNTAGSPWPFDPRLNRGVSDFDVPHNLVINFRWDVPSPASLTGLPRFLLAGWELGGIFQANSGVPFTVKIAADRARTGNSVVALGTGAQRPDFNPAPGCTPNAINPGNPDNYVNLDCFSFPAPGFLGNLGRNTLRGPGPVNFDFSLYKNHNLFSERLKVQFRAEFFNVFNRANFQSRLTTVFDRQGRLVETAGQLRPPTITTSRQVQFGMKFLW